MSTIILIISLTLFIFIISLTLFIVRRIASGSSSAANWLTVSTTVDTPVSAMRLTASA